MLLLIKISELRVDGIGDDCRMRMEELQKVIE
jgi:hypothetical protein